MASYFIKLPKIAGTGGSSTWGSITGTLSNQTDLQSALNLKANDNAVVKLTGTQSVGGAKTFTEDVTVSKASGNAAVIIDAPLATDAKNLTFQTAGLNRWRFRVHSPNDNLLLRRYDDTGAFIDSPLEVNRSTGVVTINGSTMAAKEDVANKATNLNSPNNTTYPTTQAVINRINAEDVDYFGGGFDGDVTITSAVSIVRDMYYNNLTISGSGVINASGYRIFVAGTLTVSGSIVGGRINRLGNAGANSTTQTGGGAAGGQVARFFGGSTGAQAGANGGNAGGAGSNAVANTGNTGNLGGDAGDSGDGGAGTSAAGGVGAAPALIAAADTVINNRYSDFFYRNAAVVTGGAGGQGGSGGGGGTGNGGGGGGGGGGGTIVWVAARTLDISAATGVILASLGGNAGNGATLALGGGGGGGGGGAGGGGGYCFFAYKNLIGGPLSTFIDVSGGRGGNGGNGGTGATGGEGGGSGAGGAATIINVATGVTTQLAKGTSNPKTAPTGQTGGSGATAPTHQLGI